MILWEKNTQKLISALFKSKIDEGGIILQYVLLIYSETAPTSVTISGIPALIASTMDNPNPSKVLVSDNAKSKLESISLFCSRNS